MALMKNTIKASDENFLNEKTEDKDIQEDHDSRFSCQSLFGSFVGSPR